MDPPTLKTQKRVGETTLCDLSDIIHCTNIRAEKNTWATIPMAKTDNDVGDILRV